MVVIRIIIIGTLVKECGESPAGLHAGHPALIYKYI